MHFKKALSVLLAVLMLFSVMSLGLTAAAEEINYAAQYEMLADALMNEHVRELTNYKVVNETLEGKNGFDKEAKGFIYDHSVVAEDNATSDILRASNRFYYIAESLMSYTYGVGCYDAGTLVSYITEKIKPFFEADGGVMYEDFYGNRYEPTPEEIEAYNKAVEEITAAGMEIDKINLPTYGIMFIEKTVWEYYNTDTVLRYFMGNSVSINAGNYYHRFSFIVKTSINAVLEDCEGIDYVPHNTINVRTAAYQFSYKKFYNETMSKAYYAFDVPTLSRVYDSYYMDYGFNRTSEDLSQTENGVTLGGQAAAYLIKTEVDTTTVPELKAAYNAFAYFLNQQYTDNKTVQWDEALSSIKESEFFATADNPRPDPTPFVRRSGIVAAGGNDYESRVEQRATELKAAIDAVRTHGKVIFSDKYSNDALVAMFGDKLGSVVRLVYLFRSSTEYPERIVRNGKSYVVNNTVANDIINDIDALISPREGEIGSGDTAVADRVAAILKQVLDIGDLLGTGKEIEYKDLNDLVGKVLAELVFSDSIINMLVELLYPMIVQLLVDNIGSIEIFGTVLGSIIDTILSNNNLAIYPNKLAERLDEDYEGQYTQAEAVLNAAGGNWENVNFENLKWGVDEKPYEQKKDAFIDALCAGLSGFTRLLVTVLCGDAEFENKSSDERFGKYYDLAVLGKLGDSSLAWLASQGLYTKLFIPLYRVLGLEETEFLSSAQFHSRIATNFKDCLEMAVTPIVDWVMNHVAKKPIETIMKLLPNLVHFLSRQGGELTYADDWENADFNGDAQTNGHRGFAQLQTHNLVTILDHVYIKIVAVGQAITIDSIAGLIGGSTMEMLGSLSGLLKSILSFTYETDQIVGYNYVCYTDEARSVIVLPGSEKYEANPGAYPVGHRAYYSNEDETQISLTETETCNIKHESPIYNEEDFYIPVIPEGMLTSVGTIDPATNTVKLEKNGEKTYGQVFVFLLRYVLSAVGYKYNINEEALPSVIECLGLDLSGELFLGLGLGDIVNNVMIHPDAAICALLELFYSGESGDLYENKPYSYPPTPIDYHASVLLDKSVNPTLTYGSSVRYSQYWTKENADDFIASLTPLAEDVLIMLGLEGMEDGLGPFIDNLLNDLVFSNDLVNTVFNLIYQLIAGLNAEELGFDIPGIAKAALDVDLSPAAVAATLKAMVGETPAWREISGKSDWAEMFPEVTKVDPETGEEYTEVEDVELDWGFDDESIKLSSGEIFLKSLASILSPAGFLIKFLFMDKDLSILGLINLPGYAGYQYAFIGLLEALSCPGILSYRDYYEASTLPVVGDANAIYYLFAPLLSLIEKVKADPINTVLSLIPNLLFFISIGGFNDLVNNLVHFVYVLLDILKPIINGYDLVEGLLANLEIEGLTIQLSLPLDVDFNALISDLVGSLLGDSLTIEGVSIKLPYIDLYTLCVGTLEAFTTKEGGRKTVFLNAVGGGDLLTAILRVALEILYIDENHVALSQIIANLAEEGRLDAYDEETLYLVLHGLIGLIEEYEVIDIILFAVYKLITILVPIADTLAERLDKNDMTITDLIDSAGNQDEFLANIGKLLEDPDKVEPTDRVPDGDAVMSLFDRIKLFFEKIKLFFQNLFNFSI